MPIIAVEEDFDEVSRLLTVLESQMTKSQLRHDTVNLNHTPFPMLITSSVEDTVTTGEKVANDDDHREIIDVFDIFSLASNQSNQLNISAGNSTSSHRRNAGSSRRSSSSHSYNSITAVEEDYDDIDDIESTNTSAMFSIPSTTNKIRQFTSIGSKLLEVEDVVSHKDVNIEDQYMVDYSREIGRGTTTIIRECTAQSTGNRYAVKSIKTIR